MKQLIFKIAFTVLSVILFYGCSTEPYDWSTTTTLEVITGECTDIQYNYAKVNMEIIDSSGKAESVEYVTVKMKILVLKTMIPISNMTYCWANKK